MQQFREWTIGKIGTLPVLQDGQDLFSHPGFKHSCIPFAARAMASGNWDTEKAVQVYTTAWFKERFMSPDWTFETCQQAIECECPSLASITLYRGKKEAMNYLLAMLTDFVTSYNVKLGTETRRLLECCGNIYLRMYWLKISEIKLVLSRARRTVVMYNAIDGNKIEQLFHEYDLERTEVVKMINKNKM
ncbi:MAG: hypothetical protein HC874_14120 [Richelia sp. SL_2_1]|nr:hypothetical protein [Richelia sp. SL_2_1]